MARESTLANVVAVSQSDGTAWFILDGQYAVATDCNGLALNAHASVRTAIDAFPVYARVISVRCNAANLRATSVKSTGQSSFSSEHSSLFQDSSKLSSKYVPAELPHREAQINDIVAFFEGSLAEPAKALPMTYRLVGEVGTGKTVTMLRAAEILRQRAGGRKVDLRCVYFNARQHGTSKLILFRHLVQQVEPTIFSLSYSAEELAVELLRHLSRSNTYVIVLVDELDYLVKHGKDSVVYSLTRLSEALPETHCNVIGLIFAGRSIDYGELLDRAELSSLGRLGPRFEPYGREEIRDVLAGRARDAFHPGTVDNEVLTTIADLTVAPPINSDIRYALELLYYAGKTADNRDAARVSQEHVREAHDLAAPPLEGHEVASLPDKQMLALLAMLEGARVKGKASLAFDEIVTAHDSVRSQYGFKKLTLRDVVRVVQDLCDRGLVEAKGLQEIRTRRIAAHGSAKFAELFQQLAVEAKRRASEAKP